MTLKTRTIPILLASQYGLGKEAYRELARISPREVYIVGEKNSIFLDLDRALEENGITVKRISIF